MKLIFIHGKPGVGKFTVGKRLQEITGFCGGPQKLDKWLSSELH
jgi:adenylate kinase family enzyme